MEQLALTRLVIFQFWKCCLLITLADVKCTRFCRDMVWKFPSTWYWTGQKLSPVSHIMSCEVIWCHVVSCYVRWYVTWLILCDVKGCCDVIWCCVWCHLMSGDVTWCNVMVCHSCVMWCHVSHDVMSHDVMWCHVMSWCYVYYVSCVRQESDFPPTIFPPSSSLLSPSAPSSDTLIETDDTIEVEGHIFHKPFVEKPISAEDHTVHIYFPSDYGGGCQKLFRKAREYCMFVVSCKTEVQILKLKV